MLKSSETLHNPTPLELVPKKHLSFQKPRGKELQASNYLLIILPVPTLLNNVVTPQTVFSQNHQGSERAEFISQDFTIFWILFQNEKREYLSRSHMHVFSYFTFIIQIKRDKCWTAVPTEPSSIYELLPTKASWQHGLLLGISSMCGELFIYIKSKAMKTHGFKKNTNQN